MVCPDCGRDGRLEPMIYTCGDVVKGVILKKSNLKEKAFRTTIQNGDFEEKGFPKVIYDS